MSTKGEEQLFSEVKFFTYVGSKLFLEYAKCIVAISLKQRQAEGLGEPLREAITAGTTVVGGTVAAVVSGGLAGVGLGPKIGKVFGDLANKGISCILQVSISKKIQIIQKFKYESP